MKKLSLIFFVSCALAGTAFAETAYTDPKAVALFNFNDSSNMLTNSVEDSLITAANSGGYLNYTSGYAGTANAYNSNSNFITLTLNNAVTWNNSFSVSFAMKSNGSASTTTNWNNLFAIGSSTDHIRIQNSTNGTANPTIGVFGNANLNKGTIGLGSGSVFSLSNDWQLVTFVWDVTATDSATLKFYLDGVLKDTSNPITISSLAPLTALSIGGTQWGNQYNGGAYFDELVVYDQALSQATIANKLLNQPATLSVPEPSLFGVFAGAFALVGVVGARRRRSSKKA